MALHLVAWHPDINLSHRVQTITFLSYQSSFALVSEGFPVSSIHLCPLLGRNRANFKLGQARRGLPDSGGILIYHRLIDVLTQYRRKTTRLFKMSCVPLYSNVFYAITFQNSSCTGTLATADSTFMKCITCACILFDSRQSFGWIWKVGRLQYCRTFAHDMLCQNSHCFALLSTVPSFRIHMVHGCSIQMISTDSRFSTGCGPCLTLLNLTLTSFIVLRSLACLPCIHSGDISVRRL